MKTWVALEGMILLGLLASLGLPTKLQAFLTVAFGWSLPICLYQIHQKIRQIKYPACDISKVALERVRKT